MNVSAGGPEAARERARLEGCVLVADWATARLRFPSVAAHRFVTGDPWSRSPCSRLLREVVGCGGDLSRIEGGDAAAVRREKRTQVKIDYIGGQVADDVMLEPPRHDPAFHQGRWPIAHTRMSASLCARSTLGKLNSLLVSLRWRLLGIFRKGPFSFRQFCVQSLAAEPNSPLFWTPLLRATVESKRPDPAGQRPTGNAGGSSP
jgi:hypothetical protein